MDLAKQLIRNDLNHFRLFAEECSGLDAHKRRSNESNEVAEDYLSSYLLVGTDEVGRGPLAGPVTTATFSIDYSKLLAAHRWGTKRLLASLYLKNIASDIGALAVINDSKKLKAKDRKALCNELFKLQAHHSINSKTAEEIDKYGIVDCIWQNMAEGIAAVIEAQERAVTKLLVLVDGPHKIKKLEERLVDLLDKNTVEAMTIKQVAIKKGDSHSFCIAAAANLAKEDRDAKMQALANKKQFSYYGWDTNVGYGSAKHRAAIQEHGMSKEHRRSFCGSFR